MKIDSHTIFEIHRLEQAGYKQRKIARQLGISRLTVKKYLQNPKKSRVKSAGRPSKLDAYRDLIKQWLEKDPEVSAPVVLQHLAARGFDGKVTIVRDYLRKLRGRRSFAKAYLRIESPPAEQMQVDWGHFGHLIYNQTQALCTGRCGKLQPHGICAVHPQPEAGSLAPMPAGCLLLLWRHRRADRGR